MLRGARCAVRVEWALLARCIMHHAASVPPSSSLQRELAAAHVDKLVLCLTAWAQIELSLFC